MERIWKEYHGFRGISAGESQRFAGSVCKICVTRPLHIGFGVSLLFHMLYLMVAEIAAGNAQTLNVISEHLHYILP